MITDFCSIKSKSCLLEFPHRSTLVTFGWLESMERVYVLPIVHELACYTILSTFRWARQVLRIDSRSRKMSRSSSRHKKGLSISTCTLLFNAACRPKSVDMVSVVGDSRGRGYNGRVQLRTHCGSQSHRLWDPIHTRDS